LLSGAADSNSLALESLAKVVSAQLGPQLADALGSTVASKLEEMMPKVVEAACKSSLDRQIGSKPSSATYSDKDDVDSFFSPTSAFVRQMSPDSKGASRWHRTVTDLEEDVVSRILFDSSLSRPRISFGSQQGQSTSGARARAKEGIAIEVVPSVADAAVVQPPGDAAPDHEDVDVILPGTSWSAAPCLESPSRTGFDMQVSFSDRSPSKIMTNSEVLRSRVDELLEVMDSSHTTHKEPSVERVRSSCFQQHLLFCFRIGSVLSWEQASSKRLQIIYKSIVIAFAVLSFAWTLVDVTVAWRQGSYKIDELAHSNHTPLSSLLMALGAVGVLASLSWCQGQKNLDELTSVLQAYAQMHELHDLWMSRVKTDVAIVGSMYICAVAACLFRMIGSADALSALPAAAAALTVNTLLMLLVLFLLFALRLLVLLADVFCFQLVDALHVSEAARDWNLLQAVLRKASSAVQLGLLSFLALAAFAIPVFMLDYVLLGPSLATLQLQLPHLLVVLGVLRIFIMASTVTGKCIRVAPLINSLDFGPGTDRDSQDLVVYIQNSAAGFYIFDVRLTTGMVVKFMYVWAVVVFGIVSRGLSEG